MPLVGEERPGPSADRRRLTVPEAADALGVTVDAIRGRIRRGTLHSERESGTVYVWVDLPDADWREPSAGSRRPSHDQSELIEEMRARIEDLREQLDEERESRRRADTIIAQLSAANAEQARTIRAIEAPREPSDAQETLGSPSEAAEMPMGPERSEAHEYAVTEQPETATPQPGRVAPQPAVESTQAQESPEMHMPSAGGGPRPREQQTASERPWWRRMFGG
jgi:uncharacterized membrane protein